MPEDPLGGSNGSRISLRVVATDLRGYGASGKPPSAPDHEPYRAWANFEFIALDGSINEVDLLLLTPMGFFLVEIKSRPGRVYGDPGTHHLTVNSEGAWTIKVVTAP